MHRIFLLSPAKSSGRRAQLLSRPTAGFELAKQVQIGDATLAEVFTFCSGLYFRGKLTYARRFAKPPPGMEGVQIITPSRGLISAETAVGLDDLREFSAVAVESSGVRFTAPLRASARILAKRDGCEFVLLGSIATGKYVETLLPVFWGAPSFPGGLRGPGRYEPRRAVVARVSGGEELNYIPVGGAVRRGRRAGKLTPLETKPRRGG